MYNAKFLYLTFSAALMVLNLSSYIIHQWMWWKKSLGGDLQEKLWLTIEGDYYAGLRGQLFRQSTLLLDHQVLKLPLYYYFFFFSCIRALSFIIINEKWKRLLLSRKKNVMKDIPKFLYMLKINHALYLCSLLHLLFLLALQIVQLSASGNFAEALALCKLLPPEDSALRSSKESSIHTRWDHEIL